MGQPVKIASGTHSALSSRSFDLLAILLVFAAYTVVVTLARHLTFWEGVGAGFANTLPVIGLGALARRVIIVRLAGARLARQVAGHIALGCAFTLLSYWILTVLLGLVNGVSATEFTVQPFPNRAMAWQLLQNLTTYGLIAALSHLQARPDQVTLIISDPALAGGGERGQGLSRYFIRTGEDIHPIDVSQIVSIAGADDYAEVATLEGKHLVRMTLAEFEKALDGERFIRVHRSRIVNVERIVRAEPAGGGRLLLHMENGEIIAASRAGTRLLRDRVL